LGVDFRKQAKRFTTENRGEVHALFQTEIYLAIATTREALDNISKPRITLLPGTSNLTIRIHAVIPETVPDDHMIENVNADDLASLDKSLGDTKIFGRGSNII
jgi:hypothetical protein